MACRLVFAKPLSDPMLVYYQLVPWELTSVKFESLTKIFIQENLCRNVVCDFFGLSVSKDALFDQYMCEGWKSHRKYESIPGVNALRPSQNSWHVPDDSFNWICFIDKVWISIKFPSLNLVPKCPNDNEPPLVQIMAWRRTGDKPLPEPMLI